MSYVGGSFHNTTLHKLNMATNNAVPINEEHVSRVMAIPSTGVDMVVLKKTVPINRTYNLSVLEQNLENLPVCDEFLKIIFNFFHVPLC